MENNKPLTYADMPVSVKVGTAIALGMGLLYLLAITTGLIVLAMGILQL